MFPSNHQRYLISRFRHIDELLGDAVQALEPSRDARLFSAYVPDATPPQRRILADYLAQVRFSLKRFMQTQGVADVVRPVSGLWSLRTAIVFAQTAVAELRPSYMVGYGQLDAEAAAACERLVAELAALLRRISDYLDRGEKGDLAARLAELDAAPADAAMLRELETIITAHGLVEFRAPLEDLIERAATQRYEIAVFGRVNAGKSSLLNWWLGSALLPTGVTPITAVPTRIVHGNIARAHVQVAKTSPLVIPLNQIASYVTEAGNPGNSRQVLAITVEVPGERLVEGVCLVDTPGLGSLAAAGAMQTLEYLPRCDLAIQLIEAGGVIGREELELARAVLDGGSDLLIALSKADRLSEAELIAASDYAAAEFNAALGMKLAIDPISTVGAAAALADKWFSSQLAPRLAHHRDRAAAQLRRKAAVLREKVRAALEVRLRAASPPSGPPLAQEDIAAAPEAGAQARLELERARAELRDIVPRLRDGASWIIEGAAEALVDAWSRGETAPDTLAAPFEAAIARRATDLGDLIVEILTRCRTRIDAALPPFPAGGDSSREWPAIRGRPLLDTAGCAQLVSLARPRWIPGWRFLSHRLALRSLNAGLKAAIDRRLTTYAEALRAWSMSDLQTLGRQLEDELGLGDSRGRLSAAPPLTPEAAASLRRDLERLGPTSQKSERAAQVP
ncbi:MAG: dynamin family protein [Steroidobacteraceae bacterium]